MLSSGNNGLWIFLGLTLLLLVISKDARRYVWRLLYTFCRGVKNFVVYLFKSSSVCPQCHYEDENEKRCTNRADFYGVIIANQGTNPEAGETRSFCRDHHPLIGKNGTSMITHLHKRKLGLLSIIPITKY